MNSKTRPLTLCRISKTLTYKTCLFFLFFLELNFSFFRHFVYLPLGILYPVLLTLFAVAAILNTSPSSLETRDLLWVFSRAAAILKSEKTLGTRLSQSLYWRPPADQKASGLWVRDCTGNCIAILFLESAFFMVS